MSSLDDLTVMTQVHIHLSKACLQQDMPRRRVIFGGSWAFDVYISFACLAFPSRAHH